MPKDNFIVSLDVGASKISCLIGMPAKNDLIDVLGYGVVHHDYLKNGVVSDIKGLSDAISKAVYLAEDCSGKKAHSVFLNISGSHIKGYRSHGEVVISDRDNEITRRDVERVITNAKSIHMPYERDIIYSVNRGFSVDGEKGIVNPAGMFGLKLDADIYIVNAKISLIDNLKKAVRQSGIGIASQILSGIATSYALLSKQDKELGVMLVDIGADLTEVMIFLEGKLAHISVLPLGGDTVTEIVSERLRIPESIAERIKIENGTIEQLSRDEKIPFILNSQNKTVSRMELREALSAGYESIFTAIKKELEGSGCARDASNGIVLCGQSSMMEGALELAELILNFPMEMGHIIGLGSSPKPLASHIYATSVGLLKYGNEFRQATRSILHKGAKNIFQAMVDRAMNLYDDYF